ncbi:MAG: DUF2325 domain-containing protein [Gammaproteobacteria bacterium]|nr:DUF2325 domain-containing protein [Gammaproteobacteria bacterium]
MARARPATHRKVWEIEARFHCGVIGTCLRLEDLRTLCRRAGIVFQTAVSDYALHHAFVELADRACYATRLLQRRLDSRHRESLRHFATARDEATLIQYWEAAQASGEIAGAYWALMSHPLAGLTLCERVTGEVHMLSHLAGASRRAELQHIKQLQQRQRLLEQWLHEERQSAADRQAIIQALNQRLTKAANAEQELARARTRIAQLEQGDALRLARTCSEDLAAALANARLAADRHAAEARHWTERCQAAEHSVARTASELAATVAERDSLEQLTQSLTRQCAQDCTADCPRFDLCRRRILYVGGRPGLGPHLRQLVEQANGEFLHHDGGREEADSALAALLPGADAVLCPADCVSHSAMLRIKRSCKQQAKPFLILRSASLSAFVRGLQQLLNSNAALA